MDSPRFITRLLCTLASGTLVCLAQPDRSVLIGIADRYADSYRVPRELIHSMIDIESNWQPYVVSEKGAAGLMQLMPQTAAALGVSNRFDAEQNIRGGVSYVAHLLALFGGDVRLVAAAYYAGESRIRRYGLAYANDDVYLYVSRLVRAYRDRIARAATIVILPPRGDMEP